MSPKLSVVGYATKTVQATCYASFDLQFEDLTGAKAVAIDKLVSMGDDEHASSTGWGTAMDQIWRWDTTEGVDNGAKYGYVTEGGGRTGKPFLFFRGGSADANIEFYFGEKAED